MSLEAYTKSFTDSPASWANVHVNNLKANNIITNTLTVNNVVHPVVYLENNTVNLHNGGNGIGADAATSLARYSEINGIKTLTLYPPIGNNPQDAHWLVPAPAANLKTFPIATLGNPIATALLNNTDGRYLTGIGYYDDPGLDNPIHLLTWYVNGNNFILRKVSPDGQGIINWLENDRIFSLTMTFIGPGPVPVPP